MSELQQILGESVMTRGVTEGDSENIIFQVDGLELHIFNFTLSEGDSVYTIARETEVDPNIYSLIKRALEEGAQVDTTTMALNDRIVGIASRQGDQYALSELVYDRARSSDMLVYSNCSNLNQAASSSSVGLNSEVCMASAARMVTSAPLDLQ
jgi:transposase-like protein